MRLPAQAGLSRQLIIDLVGSTTWREKSYNLLPVGDGMLTASML